MNCAEIAATLQETLLHQRDPQWVQEARLHAEQCSGCARLLAVQELEESLAGLSRIEPADDFLESVMSRVTQPQPVALSPATQFVFGIFKYPTMFVGRLDTGGGLPRSRSRSVLALESLAVGSIPSVAQTFHVSCAASPLGDRAGWICGPADSHGPGPARPSGERDDLAGSLSQAMRDQLADRQERFAKIAIEFLVNHIRLLVERLELGIDQGRFHRPDRGVAGFGNRAKAAGSHLGQ